MRQHSTVATEPSDLRFSVHSEHIILQVKLDDIKVPTQSNLHVHTKEPKITSDKDQRINAWTTAQVFWKGVYALRFMWTSCRCLVVECATPMQWLFERSEIIVVHVHLNIIGHDKIT